MQESAANKAAAAESAYFFVNSAVPMLTKSTVADAAKRSAHRSDAKAVKGVSDGTSVNEARRLSARPAAAQSTGAAMNDAVMALTKGTSRKWHISVSKA